MALNFDYAASQAYCKSIGMTWFGDDYPGLIFADNEAKAAGLTQEQVDVVMRVHLWQTRINMSRSSYGFLQNLKFALYFLTGLKLK